MTPVAPAARDGPTPQMRPPRGRITIIQGLVAEHYGLAIGMMTSPCRLRRVARPRQIAMYLAREVTHGSLPEIGRAFKKDHTTVLHGLRTVEVLALIDPEFAATVAYLRAKAARPAA